MQDGATLTSESEEETVIPPFCRKPRDPQKAPNVNLLNLKRYLWNALNKKGGIHSADKYAEKSKFVPIYKINVPLTRFLLFVAYHDAIADTDIPGKVKDGTPNSQDLLSKSPWSNQESLTVEHVAPQSFSKDWEKEFFDSTQLTHSLGNLTLLPAVENSVFGNRSWTEKRALFDAISQTDPNVRTQLLEDLEGEISGVLTDRSKEIIKAADYRPIVKDLALYNGDWSKNFVLERSQHLSLRVWKILSGWLQPIN
nr:HNH endonuclease family protein [Ruegeria arenilitoris]